MNREELERREFEEAFKEFDKVRKGREQVMHLASLASGWSGRFIRKCVHNYEIQKPEHFVDVISEAV